MKENNQDQPGNDRSNDPAALVRAANASEDHRITTAARALISSVLIIAGGLLWLCGARITAIVFWVAVPVAVVSIQRSK